MHLLFKICSKLSNHRKKKIQNVSFTSAVNKKVELKREIRFNIYKMKEVKKKIKSAQV